MKHLHILFVFVCGITTAPTSSFAETGWFWQNPRPQGNGLSCTAGLDANTVVAVGGGPGTILRTSDGGATWTRQSARTTSFLSGLSFANAKAGLAVGSGGSILRTVDGGSSWR